MKLSAQWAASFLANPQGRYLQGTSAEKRKGMTKWGKKLIYLCSLDSVCQETQWSLALRDQTKKHPSNWKVKEMWDCNRCFILERFGEWWERVTQNISKWCGRVSWGKDRDMEVIYGTHLVFQCAQYSHWRDQELHPCMENKNICLEICLYRGA